jgi:hypothetical protein
MGGERDVGAVAGTAPERVVACMHVVLAVQTCEQMHILNLGFAE